MINYRYCLEWCLYLAAVSAWCVLVPVCAALMGLRGEAKEYR
jgi:hypothetical protein